MRVIRRVIESIVNLWIYFAALFRRYLAESFTFYAK